MVRRRTPRPVEVVRALTDVELVREVEARRALLRGRDRYLLEHATETVLVRWRALSPVARDLMEGLLEWLEIHRGFAAREV